MKTNNEYFQFNSLEKEIIDLYFDVVLFGVDIMFLSEALNFFLMPEDFLVVVLIFKSFIFFFEFLLELPIKMLIFFLPVLFLVFKLGVGDFE